MLFSCSFTIHFKKISDVLKGALEPRSRLILDVCRNSGTSSILNWCGNICYSSKYGKSNGEHAVLCTNPRSSGGTNFIP